MSKFAQDENDGYEWILFLIWPFLAAVSAFFNWRKCWSKNIFWAFCAFYGFTFSIGMESEGSDIVRYVADLQRLHEVEMSFDSSIEYFQRSGEIDILRTLIAILLSRLTDSQIVLTGIYAIIFGFFYSRNIWYVFEHTKGRLEAITILLIVCFILVYPIWKIGGFRMATASQMFLFGALPYLYEGKYKGFWIAVLSVLVHFSFMVPVGLLFTHYVAGNRLTLYFVFYISTFFISEIDISVLNNVIESYFPDILQERTSSYRSEERVMEMRDGSVDTRNWYAIWYAKSLRWSVMGFLALVYFRGRTLFRENRGWMNLFCFILLFYGVANLLSSVPSGYRYLTVANLFALPLIILYLQNNEFDKYMRSYIYVATPALLLFVVVSFRESLYTLSATSIIGNPLLAVLFQGEHLSLNDVLRMIL